MQVFCYYALGRSNGCAQPRASSRVGCSALLGDASSRCGRRGRGAHRTLIRTSLFVRKRCSALGTFVLQETQSQQRPQQNDRSNRTADHANDAPWPRVAILSLGEQPEPNSTEHEEGGPQDQFFVVHYSLLSLDAQRPRCAARKGASPLRVGTSVLLGSELIEC